MFTIKSVVYPKQIAKILSSLRSGQPAIDSNASATAANFTCGSFVRFSMHIDAESQIVDDAGFSSNGCGFMLAAADALAERVVKQRLVDLHGLADTDLKGYIRENIGEISSNRRLCVEACIEALRSAFADFRLRQIDEFQGDKALICTCFGVSEETIEVLIAKDALKTVDEVAATCNAGAGCGSCRMLIHEMLDDRRFNS